MQKKKECKCAMRKEFTYASIKRNKFIDCNCFVVDANPTVPMLLQKFMQCKEKSNLTNFFNARKPVCIKR